MKAVLVDGELDCVCKSLGAEDGLPSLMAGDGELCLTGHHEEASFSL